MAYRKLGKTALSVSPLCLGGNVFGWTANEQQSFAVLDAYMEGGGNFIDTADTYSAWLPCHVGGESESILGRWMRARNNRSRVILATKVGSRMGTAPDAYGLSRRYILEEVEASLRRLQTDYIDLYLELIATTRRHHLRRRWPLLIRWCVRARCDLLAPRITALRACEKHSTSAINMAMLTIHAFSHHTI